MCATTRTVLMLNPAIECCCGRKRHDVLGFGGGRILPNHFSIAAISQRSRDNTVPREKGSAAQFSYGTRSQILRLLLYLFVVYFNLKFFLIYLFVFAVLSLANCKLFMYYLFIILPIIYLAKNGLKAKFKEI